ncbi:hypothetical protein HBH98_139180 [Parastagonospora nodorum]|nr:hypothetical protein HBH51_121090 [Parastagonospora nodorum]KAH3988918.1 hypothetical protein HBH52_029590 [Parastagonospora nodorum]KAH3993262.1 hypothetical protein HBI10_204910 [Parastagonospora nodorum]KAH4011133.1 hypothetical protein HBI13_200660 [Parastagonospora nodorum]KAH4053732.1 hypothetical protein HBH49_087750 [Parastagonospora nodorum]
MQSLFLVNFQSTLPVTKKSSTSKDWKYNVRASLAIQLFPTRTTKTPSGLSSSSSQLSTAIMSWFAFDPFECWHMACPSSLRRLDPLEINNGKGSTFQEGYLVVMCTSRSIEQWNVAIIANAPNL